MFNKIRRDNEMSTFFISENKESIHKLKGFPLPKAYLNLYIRMFILLKRQIRLHKTICKCVLCLDKQTIFAELLRLHDFA